MKKSFKFIIIFVVLILLVMFSKNLIARTVINNLVKSITGLHLSIKSINLGITTTNIDVEDLKLYNPRGFHDKIMADIPQIYIDYSLGALLKRKIYFREIKFDLKEFVVIKNKDGKLNIDSLKTVKKGKKEEVKEKREGLLKMQVDILHLKIERVIYKDYTKGLPPPMIKKYNINLNEKYTNITDPQQLAQLILYKALIKTSIAKLAGFSIDFLQHNLSNLLRQTGILGKPALKAMELGEGAEGAVKEVGEKLKGVLEDIKLPIGAEEKNK